MPKEPTDTTAPVSPWRSIEALAERLNKGADKPTMTAHGIRHYVRNADENGLTQANAVRHLGRKLLIHEPRFLYWLENLK